MHLRVGTETTPTARGISRAPSPPGSGFCTAHRVCIHIYIYIYMCIARILCIYIYILHTLYTHTVHIYIYIYRERERDIACYIILCYIMIHYIRLYYTTAAGAPPQKRRLPTGSQAQPVVAAGSRTAADKKRRVMSPRRGRRADLCPMFMSCSRDVDVKIAHFRVGVRLSYRNGDGRRHGAERSVGRDEKRKHANGGGR